MMKGMAGTALRRVEVTVATDSYDLNLFVAAGSPAEKCLAIVTIAAGVTIRNATGVAAVRTGSGWALGSVVKLINKGSIYSKGGVGGIGGADESDSPVEGGAGTDAICLDTDLLIDNLDGVIWAGGGGGAGGAGRGAPDDGGVNAAGGGGGGGGQGDPGGPGGLGGFPGAGVPGNAGAGGSFSGPGNGGTGGINIYSGARGAKGQTGRAWGVGGAYAVRQYGHAVTWLAGYNDSQVKGLVA